MTDVQQASQAFMRAADRTSTLYALSDEYLHLVDLLDGGEMDVDEVEHELDRIGGAIAHKAESIAGLIRWYQGLADMRKAEAKRMTDSVASFERQAERLKAYVLANMIATGHTRLDTGRFTLSVRQNPARVEIVEEDQIPDDFKRRREIVEVDKRAILAYTKETGQIIDGTDIVRGTRLDIR